MIDLLEISNVKYIILNHRIYNFNSIVCIEKDEDDSKFILYTIENEIIKIYYNENNSKQHLIDDFEKIKIFLECAKC